MQCLPYYWCWSCAGCFRGRVCCVASKKCKHQRIFSSQSVLGADRETLKAWLRLSMSSEVQHWTIYASSISSPSFFFLLLQLDMAAPMFCWPMLARGHSLALFGFECLSGWQRQHESSTRHMLRWTSSLIERIGSCVIGLRQRRSASMTVIGKWSAWKNKHNVRKTTWCLVLWPLVASMK